MHRGNCLMFCHSSSPSHLSGRRATHASRVPKIRSPVPCPRDPCWSLTKRSKKLYVTMTIFLYKLSSAADDNNDNNASKIPWIQISCLDLDGLGSLQWLVLVPLIFHLTNDPPPQKRCQATVVDEMFQVLAHSHLSHQAILVAVHTCQLSHVGKDVLQTSVERCEKCHDIRLRYVIKPHDIFSLHPRSLR